MNSTIGIYEEDKAGAGGYSLFIYFVVSIALSQFLLDYSRPASGFFLFISFLLTALVVAAASRIQLLFFLFFTILMNILIPFTMDRTFSQVFPLIFFIVIFLKSKAFEKKVGVNLIIISLLLYFLFVFFTFFSGLKLPFNLSGQKTANTGFLARWNLLNTFFVFTASLLSFKVETLADLLRKFYKLLLVILIIALVIFYFNITFKLPLFNTFSWSIVYEGAGSKRMGIAGLSATYLFIYFLCFKTKSKNAWIIFLLVVLGVIASGGRSAMVTFLLIAYLNWLITHRILIKSFVISCIVVLAFIAFSFSPLILHIPQNLQRVFIIFPKEFYSGSLQELGNTAAANSSTFRYTMWKMAAPDIRDHILFGKGLGIPKESYSFSQEGMSAFQSKPPEIIFHDFMAGGQLHNTFVSVAFIMGIPAVLFFTYAFLGLIYKTYQRYLHYVNTDHAPYIKFLLLVLFANLISSMFGDIYFDLMFFIFLAITLKTIIYLDSGAASRAMRRSS
jgi:hypothetical protein